MSLSADLITEQKILEKLIADCEKAEQTDDKKRQDDASIAARNQRLIVEYLKAKVDAQKDQAVTSIIIDEAEQPPTMKETEKNDATLLKRVRDTAAIITNEAIGATVVVENDKASDWTLKVNGDVINPVYACSLLTPTEQDDTSTVGNAITASTNMSKLIDAEKVRIQKLQELYEDLNMLKGKTSAEHSDKSAGANAERLDRLKRAQQLEKEKANLVIVTRKAQASVLQSDSILKTFVDKVNLKQNIMGVADLSLDTFPEPFKS